MDKMLPLGSGGFLSAFAIVSRNRSIPRFSFDRNINNWDNRSFAKAIFFKGADMTEKRVVKIDEIFPQEIMERAEYFICFDDESDDDFLMGNTITEAIDAYLWEQNKAATDEVWKYILGIGESIEFYIAAMIDVSDEEDDDKHEELARRRIRLSLNITVINEDNLNAETP